MGVVGGWNWTACAVLAMAFACTGAPQVSVAQPPTVAEIQPFDLRVLHLIELQIAPEHLEAFDHDRERRVPCDITLNGHTLRRVGVRQKGDRGSASSLAGKPGMSLKFDQFVEGQKWWGVDRLLLNNARQDRSLLNEHLAYELYRQAGIPAPRTAHALVVINGEVKGLYVLRDAYDRRYLRRAFGDGSGNLYEGVCCLDFAGPSGSPSALDLKDEERQGRTREDLAALTEVVDTVPDERLEAALQAHLDLPALLRGYALDAVLGHWDGFAFNLNNYYLYRRPYDDRFIFLPHGADQLVDREGFDPLRSPTARLAQRVWSHPTLREQFEAELRWVLSRGWDGQALRERAEQVREIVAQAPADDPEVRDAVRRFERAWARQLRRFEARRAFLEEQLDLEPER
jgi:spore coat protein H